MKAPGNGRGHREWTGTRYRVGEMGCLGFSGAPTRSLGRQVAQLWLRSLRRQTPLARCEGELGAQCPHRWRPPPILARLGLPASVWLKLVSDFGKLFPTMAGLPHRVERVRTRKRGLRYHIPDAARELLSPSQSA